MLELQESGGGVGGDRGGDYLDPQRCSIKFKQLTYAFLMNKEELLVVLLMPGEQF